MVKTFVDFRVNGSFQSTLLGSLSSGGEGDGHGDSV